MDNLNIYRDGSLPHVEQRMHQPNVQILRCSYWALQAWNHNNLHSPYWRLYWNRQAGARVIRNEVAHELAPDRLLLIGPNTPFTSRLGGERWSEESNILVGYPFHERGLPQADDLVGHFFVHFTIGQPYDSIEPCLYELPIGDEVLGEIALLTKALGSNRNQFDHRQSFALQALIHYSLTGVPQSDWPEAQIDARILRTFSYIDEHLSQPLRNEDFGKVANMSANAFTRLFKMKTGITPLAYLNQRRLEKASILLHHSDLTLDDIAEQCGFLDRNYFSRVFQKCFKVGPATYRKNRAV